MFAQVVTTFGASAERLSADMAATYNDPPIRQIGIQADAANANAFFIGDANVTSSLYAVRIPAPVSSLPVGPMIIDFPVGSVVKLSDIWVKGTSTEILHGWVVY